MRYDDPDLISLSQAAGLVPGQPHPSTLWRWAHIGKHGVRLETIELGGESRTTPEALQAFFEAVTAAKKKKYAPNASL